jgi:hypothetical protein
VAVFNFGDPLGQKVLALFDTSVDPANNFLRKTEPAERKFIGEKRTPTRNQRV